MSITLKAATSTAKEKINRRNAMKPSEEQFPKPIPSIAKIWGNTRAIPELKEILDEGK